MLSYRAAQASRGILELENRCTGNRTVGSNPTLSVRCPCYTMDCGGFAKLRYTSRYTAQPLGHGSCYRAG